MFPFSFTHFLLFFFIYSWFCITSLSALVIDKRYFVGGNNVLHGEKWYWRQYHTWRNRRGFGAIDSWAFNRFGLFMVDWGWAGLEGKYLYLSLLLCLICMSEWMNEWMRLNECMSMKWWWLVNGGRCVCVCVCHVGRMRGKCWQTSVCTNGEIFVCMECAVYGVIWYADADCITSAVVLT